MAKESTNNGAPAGNPVNQLDAIKNIIFGAEMEKITDDLRGLSDQQQKDVTDLADKLNKIEAALTAEMQEMREALLSEMNTRMDSLQADLDKVNESKADRRQLGEWLVKLGQDMMKD